MGAIIIPDPTANRAATVRERRRGPLQPADQQFALVDHFRRQMVVQIDEQLLVVDDFRAPGGAIEGLQLLELLLRKLADPSTRCPRSAGIQPIGVSLPRARPRTRSTIHFSTRMFSLKPGHRNLPSASLRNQFTWKMRGVSLRVALHLDPVPEIVAHVIAAEGQHGHRIAAHLADGAAPRRRSFPSPSSRRCRHPRSS